MDQCSGTRCRSTHVVITWLKRPLCWRCWLRLCADQESGKTNDEIKRGLRRPR